MHTGSIAGRQSVTVGGFALKQHLGLAVPCRFVGSHCSLPYTLHPSSDVSSVATKTMTQKLFSKLAYALSTLFLFVQLECIQILTTTTTTRAHSNFIEQIKSVKNNNY